MVLAGTGGIYEILLIVLVVILIYNGLLRQKIMKKVHDDITVKNSPKETQKKNKIDENHEYIDFEEVKED